MTQDCGCWMPVRYFLLPKYLTGCHKNKTFDLLFQHLVKKATSYTTLGAINDNDKLYNLRQGWEEKTRWRASEWQTTNKAVSVWGAVCPTAKICKYTNAETATRAQTRKYRNTDRRCKDQRETRISYLHSCLPPANWPKLPEFTKMMKMAMMWWSNFYILLYKSRDRDLGHKTQCIIQTTCPHTCLLILPKKISDKI